MQARGGEKGHQTQEVARQIEGSSTATRPSESMRLLGATVRFPLAVRALRHSNFRLFWSGQLVSLVGTWMQMVARGWLVLELTGSAFWLGMVGFATSVPVLAFSLFAGSVADRVSKRKLVIGMQAISMVMALLLALLTYLRVVEVWHVLAISVVLGTAFAFDAPARQAFTADMVGKDDLMNAVALNSAIFNGARVVGPAIGAVALAWQGPGLAFLLNGLSYIAVIAGLLKMDIPNKAKPASDQRSGRGVMEGLRYVRNHDTLFTLMMLIATVSIFAFPYSVLMPIFADQILHVGKEGYGMLMTLSGVGSLVGALSLMAQSARKNAGRGRNIMMGALGMPLFLGVFAVSSNYLLSLAVLVGVGWTMIAVNATINTVVQTSVPDELRGRVNGVFAFLFVGMAPFGNLQAGLVADNFGAPIAILLGAVVCALVALYVLIFKRHIASLD